MQQASPIETTSVEASAAWILRRVGFGATSADLDHATEIGIESLLAELFEPDAMGIDDDGDPWNGMEIPLRAEGRGDLALVIRAWFDRMTNHSRPVSEWLAWYWHGHLVTSAAVVRSPLGMVEQLRLFRSLGSGPFAPLLRATTIDAAMLRYLDGARSTGSEPNENYSRELLELFALGVGNYTEADVQAGARALTGWTGVRGSAEAVFRPRRHDDTSQTYLGVSGVHDLDTVINAVVTNPACPRFLTRSIADEVLGPGVTGPELDQLTANSADDDLTIGPLLEGIVRLGVAGLSEPIVLGPVPWLAGAIRATGATLDTRSIASVLRAAGQIPMVPPNVAGWPTGEAWFSTSTTAARIAAASLVANAAHADSAPVRAASNGDLDGLARSLGRPAGFSVATADALLATEATGPTLIALALSTPDLVIA